MATTNQVDLDLGRHGVGPEAARIQAQLAAAAMKKLSPKPVRRVMGTVPDMDVNMTPERLKGSNPALDSPSMSQATSGESTRRELLSNNSIKKKPPPVVPRRNGPPPPPPDMHVAQTTAVSPVSPSPPSYASAMSPTTRAPAPVNPEVVADILPDLPNLVSISSGELNNAIAEEKLKVERELHIAKAKLATAEAANNPLTQMLNVTEAEADAYLLGGDSAIEASKSVSIDKDASQEVSTLKEQSEIVTVDMSSAPHTQTKTPANAEFEQDENSIIETQPTIFLPDVDANRDLSVTQAAPEHNVLVIPETAAPLVGEPTSMRVIETAVSVETIKSDVHNIPKGIKESSQTAKTKKPKGRKSAKNEKPKKKKDKQNRIISPDSNSIKSKQNAEFVAATDVLNHKDVPTHNLSDKNVAVFMSPEALAESQAAAEFWKPRKKVDIKTEEFGFIKDTTKLVSYAGFIGSDSPAAKLMIERDTERALQQGKVASEIHSRLSTWRVTAQQHQMATLDLARYLADHCDDFAMDPLDVADVHVECPIARQAVIFQEIAIIQKALDQEVSVAIRRVERLLSEYADLKSARKCAKDASTKKVNAYKDFLSTPGSDAGFNETHFAKYRKKGMAALKAASNAQHAVASQLKSLAQISTTTKLGISETIQELAQIALAKHREMGLISVAVGADTTLGGSANRAVEAYKQVCTSLEIVETEMVAQAHLDQTALDDPRSIKVDEDCSIPQQAEPVAQLANVFTAYELPSDVSDQKFLERLKADEAAAAKAGISLHQWMNDQVKARMEFNFAPKQGLLFRRERHYGVLSWKPRYFACCKEAFVHIEPNGKEVIVCHSLRGAVVKRIEISPEMQRNYCFQITTAQSDEPIVLQATCFRELTEWTKGLKRVMDGAFM